ncbi:hypothetical protein EV421DRAFT_2019280 [Armillaria borealis]|uniref:Uncharacterized protein n=1 Tax=Armillaria borealis TaxID=47425 RepID=A0AA39JHG9_9AGAR|nr:hypothetical protein EV421DRAFT_2019280 [Armillaria borealis]
MHLALAIFLSGLVVFLHPLRAALAWIICAATAVVYAAYVLAAILPILFPQCPYRTPLSDLIYVSFCRIIPQVSRGNKEDFVIAWRRRDFSGIFRCLSRVRARNSQSLTMAESEVVKQTSTNLAAEALDWLFSVSSDPIVQSIVVQSIGGLPVASEEKLLALRGKNTAMDTLRNTLLERCLQPTVNDLTEPVPGMELKLGRLLRFHPRFQPPQSIVTPGIDSFVLTAAILSNGYSLYDRETFGYFGYVAIGSFFIEFTRSSKLPPRSWYHLMMVGSGGAVDLDNDDHANMFPLHLCSAIISSFDASKNSLTQDFDSPLVLDFKDALPYFLDKIHDRVLCMFSKFVEDPSLDEPSSPQSLRVFAVVIKFLLHRLSLPEFDMSHTTIYQSLSTAVRWILRQTCYPQGALDDLTTVLEDQEAHALITVLEDIMAPCVVLSLNIESKNKWIKLCREIIQVYRILTTISPSACSLRGLRSMVDIMTANWGHTLPYFYPSDNACRVLTDLLAKRIPVAFTAFLENQCLQFLGSQTFREASVPFVSEYVAGIFAMQYGSDGPVDEATLQSHIDYLHNPHNLFIVCSILATHGVGNIDQDGIYRDITTLVQLCPQDVAWDECRRKLNDLV